MRTVLSKDGTAIAFDQSGQGPALILVDILPNAKSSTLAGQDHGPADEVLTPALVGFFKG